LLLIREERGGKIHNRNNLKLTNMENSNTPSEKKINIYLIISVIITFFLKIIFVFTLLLTDLIEPSTVNDKSLVNILPSFIRYMVAAWIIDKGVDFNGNFKYNTFIKVFGLVMAIFLIQILVGSLFSSLFS